ncbi:MAG TPA: DUF4129 domain-containing protein, partial [Anaerolineales bacterium]|nr:DUF4129 domain-containing protein [Anaerolineales bacterium]
FLREMFQQAALEATTTPFPTAPGQVEQAYPVAYPPANVFAFAPYCVSIIFWLAVVLALILIINSSRKRLRPYPSALGQSESLFSDEETLLDALRKAARDRFQEAADALGRLRPGRRRLAARVRQLYAELLDLARELDAPRPEGKTPLEFLPILEEEFAGLGAELNVLTQAYVRVRYGELPESVEEVRQVEAAWERLRHTGEQRKKELKALAQEALKRQKKKP